SSAVDSLVKFLGRMEAVSGYPKHSMSQAKKNTHFHRSLPRRSDNTQAAFQDGQRGVSLTRARPAEGAIQSASANVGDARPSLWPLRREAPARWRCDPLQKRRKTCKSQHNSLDDAPAREVTVLSCCVAMVATSQLEPRITDSCAAKDIF